MDKFDHEIDDILDNIDFKPITKGLGFHHSLKEQKEVKVNLKRQSESLKNEIETRMNQLNIADSQTNKPNAVNMGELAPFYTETITETKVQETNLFTESEEVAVAYEDNEASMGMRASAWLIDFTILISLMLVTFTAIIYFADLPMEFINTIMVSDDLAISFLVITTMFYIFYFSFFEKTNFSTPGKNIMGLKVKSFSSKNVSLFQSFARSILGIISLPLLGLPMLLKLHDKFTDTIVVHKSK